LADALDSGSSLGNQVQVQLLSSALKTHLLGTCDLLVPFSLSLSLLRSGHIEAER